MDGEIYPLSNGLRLLSEKLRKEDKDHMTGQFLETQLNYVKKLYKQCPEDLEDRLVATRENDDFYFKAFGEPCCLSPSGILLSGERATGPLGVLIALYALNSQKEAVQLYPLQSFQQIMGSGAYRSASNTFSEKNLIPYVISIQDRKDKIISDFDGCDNGGKEGARGDFSFTLYPLPKVPLFYNFYLPDEEFAASVTCLYAANAKSFLPVDTIGDVTEFAGRKIIELATS